MKVLLSLIIIILFCSFSVLGFSYNRVKAKEKEVKDGVERVAEDVDVSGHLKAEAFTISVFHFPWATIHRARGEAESLLNSPSFHGSWGFKADVPNKDAKFHGGPFTGLFDDELPDVKIELGNKVDIDGCEAYGFITGNHSNGTSSKAHAEIPFGEDNGGGEDNGDGDNNGNGEDNEEGSADTPTLGISVSGSDQTYQPGDGITLNLVTDSAYYTVDWYVHTPGDTSSSGTHQQYDYGGSPTSTEASLSYTFPSGAMHTGDFLFRAVIYRWSDMSSYEETYTVTVE